MIGTPLSYNATKILLLGAGELGKEFVIEAIRLGIEIVAVDSYQYAPAQQVAQKYYVIDMKNKELIKSIAYKEAPDFIVPEIEAINTDALIELEQEGFNVVPCAKAVKYTMNRIAIRRFAAEELRLPTSKYKFVNTFDELKSAAKELGYPVVVKPVMSSSGKGQSVVYKEEELEKAFYVAKEKARGDAKELIVEEFIDFDYEITMLTVRTKNQGILFCPPIGHIQVEGDYYESWQPHPMDDNLLQKAQDIAKTVVEGLGGYGIFGCELFVRKDEVIFNEISPRPHDTGMVTMISQNMSEFEIHLRAILGLPIHIELLGAGASYCFHAKTDGIIPAYDNLEEALSIPNTKLRIFGKPITRTKRRMGVALALAKDVDTARQNAKKVASSVKIIEENI
ncbi:formate-dependent phosphoribosylglycinamide formyltransferase [Hydrogenobaculum acidophilum]